MGDFLRLTVFARSHRSLEIALEQSIQGGLTCRARVF